MQSQIWLRVAFAEQVAGPYLNELPGHDTIGSFGHAFCGLHTGVGQLLLLKHRPVAPPSAVTNSNDEQIDKAHHVHEQLCQGSLDIFQASLDHIDIMLLCWDPDLVLQLHLLRHDCPGFLIGVL